MLDIFYNKVFEICSIYVPKRNHVTHKKSPIPRDRAILMCRRGRVNKILVRVKSPSRREKLSKELIQIELCLQSSYKTSQISMEAKAIEKKSKILLLIYIPKSFLKLKQVLAP